MSSKLPYTVGSKPHTVRVYRRSGRQNLYMRYWDPDARNGKGGFHKQSLGHDNVDKAKAEAAELHARLVDGSEPQTGDKLTLGRLFALYLQHKSPEKGEQAQGADERRAELDLRA